MKWLLNDIDKIRKLLSADTPQSLTYAALECRLSIEKLCYERLLVAHDYISHEDVSEWRPAYVVNKLLQEVDDNIASDLKLSMSDTPLKEGEVPNDAASYEEYEYREIGVQVGFDPKKISSLWNALSSFLHVKLPKTSSDPIFTYSNTEKLKNKIGQVLEEFERLSKSTLILVGGGPNVSIECICGQINKRRVKFLRDGQVMNCINPQCKESWKVEFADEDILFERLKVSVNCSNCAKAIAFPKKPVMELDRDSILRFECEYCKAENYIAWKLKQVSPVL